jgi:hypothetical protein
MPLRPQAMPTKILNPGEALAHNLENQIAGYNAYAGLLEEQRQALLHSNIPRLEAANSAIDAAVSALLQLEVDREALVLNILETAGLYRRRPEEAWLTRTASAPVVKCEEIAAHLPPAQAQRLLQARDTLRAILTATQNALRINAALAENGERLIAVTLAAVTSVAGRSSRDSHFTYNTRGQSLLPRRQIRSLVNRKA